ncbi:trehalose 6-phosphate synthase [Candidatus Margulisiibacteriota bacterium]
MLIESLQQFYSLMLATQVVRKKITELYLDAGKTAISSESQLIDPLIEAFQSLESIPFVDGKYRLNYSEDKSIQLDLTYEIEELKKDIYFLSNSEEEFDEYLCDLYPGFAETVKQGEKFLGNRFFNSFITDRDGTVNNYCGRYISSVQSAYNAVFLSRFAQNCARNSVILTSAPLDNIGLADISVSPDNTFIYAGSKGREYFNKQGERKQLPIKKDKQNKLDELNKKLGELVKQPDYEIYSLIGSGLQYKFGQTTIARQDINNSIPAEDSESFLTTIKTIVKDTDPQGNYFRIEDTGKDIEIILTIENSHGSDELKDFDKGNGISYLDKELGLELEKGPNLICGDTGSDIPMAAVSMEKTDNTYAVFVTDDDNLKQKVKEICPNAFFVPNPDILVTILNNLGKQQIGR